MTEQTKATLATLADEALECFHAGERISTDTGRAIRCTDHNTEPAWVRDLRFAAHTDPDGGSMLPDDWRHEMIEDALRLVSESADEDGARERLDEAEAPIYNAELMRWMGSHLWRPTYCDDAAEEYGGEAGGMVNRMALGYLHEFRNVFESVLASLRAEQEAREEAAEN